MTGNINTGFVRSACIEFQTVVFEFPFFFACRHIVRTIPGAKFFKIILERGSKMAVIIACYAFRKALAPQIIKIISRRRKRCKTSRVNNAIMSNGHAVRTDKIQIAANPAILNGVNGTLYINTGLYQINQVVNC